MSSEYARQYTRRYNKQYVNNGRDKLSSIRVGDAAESFAIARLIYMGIDCGLVPGAHGQDIMTPWGGMDVKVTVRNKKTGSIQRRNRNAKHPLSVAIIWVVDNGTWFEKDLIIEYLDGRPFPIDSRLEELRTASLPSSA